MKAINIQAGSKAIALPSYIVKSDKGEQQTQISVRIPVSLHKDFESAKTALRKKGFDMQLATVVRLALENAIQTAKKQYEE